MNIDINKIKELIVRDQDGKILVSITPNLLSISKMRDKTQILEIQGPKK